MLLFLSTNDSQLSPFSMKHRLLRVNELLKRELSTIITREITFAGVLVTVNQVDVTPDLKHAHLEDRLIAVGRTAQGRPLFVAFTIRERFGQPTIRPVSARYMHEREAKNYETQGSKNDH